MAPWSALCGTSRRCPEAKWGVGGDGLVFAADASKCRAWMCVMSMSSSSAAMPASLHSAAMSAPVYPASRAPTASRSTSGERHLLRRHPQNLSPVLRVRGQGDVEEPVEAPGAEQRRVDEVRHVRRGDDRNLGPRRVGAVHLGEQLREYLSCTLTPPSPPPPSDRVCTKPSISSMNMTDGADVFARLNRVRTAFSESPTHLL